MGKKKKVAVQSPTSPTGGGGKAAQHTDTHHGHTRSLPFHWLRDKKNPAVKEYLKVENAYATRMMRRMTHNFEAFLVEELESREAEGGAYIPDRDEHYYYYERSDDSDSSSESGEDGEGKKKKKKAEGGGSSKRNNKKKKANKSKKITAKVKPIPPIDWTQLKNSNGGGDDGWTAMQAEWSSDSSDSWASSDDDNSSDDSDDDDDDDDLTPWYRCPVVEGKDLVLDMARKFAQDPTAKFPKQVGEECISDARFLKSLEGHDKLACGSFSVSPNKKLVVSAIDTTEGEEKYGVRVHPVGSHRMLRQIGHINCASEVAWASDSIFLYFTLDATHRPHKVWAHDLRKFSDVSVNVPVTASTSATAGGEKGGLSNDALAKKQKVAQKKKEQQEKREKQRKLTSKSSPTAASNSVTKEQEKQQQLWDELERLNLIGQDKEHGPADTLLFEELDPQFEIVNLMPTGDKMFILVETQSNQTSEILMLPVGQDVCDAYLDNTNDDDEEKEERKDTASRVLQAAGSRMCIFCPRSRGWLYDIAHHKGLPLKHLIQAKGPESSDQAKEDHSTLQVAPAGGEEDVVDKKECWLVLHNEGGASPNKTVSYYCPPPQYTGQRLPPKGQPLCEDHRDWHQLVDFTIIQSESQQSDQAEEGSGSTQHHGSFWIVEAVEAARDFILFTARRGDLLCSTVFVLDLTDPVVQQHELPIHWSELLDVAPLVAPIGLGLPAATKGGGSMSASPTPASTTTATPTAGGSYQFSSSPPPPGASPPPAPTSPPGAPTNMSPLTPTPYSPYLAGMGTPVSTANSCFAGATFSMLGVNINPSVPFYEYPHFRLYIDAPLIPNRELRMDRRNLPQPSTKKQQKGRTGGGTPPAAVELPPQHKRWNPRLLLMDRTNGYKMHNYATELVEVPIPWHNEDDDTERTMDKETQGAATVGVNPYTTFCEQEDTKKGGKENMKKQLTVPVLLTYKKDKLVKGSNPCFMHAYGSYGDYCEGEYDESWLSLLDRGVVVAYAGVRGGGEFGELWRKSGNMMYRKNTFRDFISCVEFLGKPESQGGAGWVDPKKIVARGASAGGCVMGAILNARPDLFAGVIAAVPFTDCMTMMLDSTQPLTTQEWDEWGNPARSKEVYEYLLSYSPADNVLGSIPLTEREMRQSGNFPATAGGEQDGEVVKEGSDCSSPPAVPTLPHVLVLSGWGDARVPYYDPATWVANLRKRWAALGGAEPQPNKAQAKNSSTGKSGTEQQQQHESSFLLHKCDMHAGHDGGDMKADTAMEFAFALYCFGGAGALRKKAPAGEGGKNKKKRN